MKKKVFWIEVEEEDILDKFQEEFIKELERKTGWGKKEVAHLFRVTLARILMKEAREKKIKEDNYKGDYDSELEKGWYDDFEEKKLYENDDLPF